VHGQQNIKKQTKIPENCKGVSIWINYSKHNAFGKYRKHEICVTGKQMRGLWRRMDWLSLGGWGWCGRAIPEAIAHSSSLTSVSRPDLAWLRVATETKNMKRKPERRPPSVVTQHENKQAVLHPTCSAVWYAVETLDKGLAIYESDSFVRKFKYIRVVNKSFSLSAVLWNTIKQKRYVKLIKDSLLQYGHQ